MKKIMIMIALIGSLQANQLNLNITDNPYYVAYKISQDKSEESYILDIQPTSEIVGQNGQRHELFLGLSAEVEEGRDIAKVFFYYWNTPEKNNEQGFGLGGNWIFRPYNTDFGIIFGGKAGIGKQNMIGKTATYSTNASKIGYVLSSEDEAEIPTNIEYVEDNYVVSISLMTGISYTLTKDIEVELGFEYRQDTYQVGYVNEGSSNQNGMTFKQDVWNSGLSVSYSF